MRERERAGERVQARSGHGRRERALPRSIEPRLRRPSASVSFAPARGASETESSASSARARTGRCGAFEFRRGPVPLFAAAEDAIYMDEAGTIKPVLSAVIRC